MNKTLMLLLVATTSCAMSLEKLAIKTEDKVVKGGVVTNDGRRGSGSGVFIDNKGTVLTCAHVVSDAIGGKVFIKIADGSFMRGYIIRWDSKKDLALVRTDFVLTPYIRLAKEVHKGQQVASFGSPLGLRQTVSIGYVLNSLENFGKTVHSAFILPGSSGGPLVNTKGQLVGINEAMLMLNPFASAPGYCIAIDIETIKAFLEGK